MYSACRSRRGRDGCAMWRVADPVSVLLLLLAARLAAAAPAPRDDLLQDQWWYNTCDSFAVQQARHQHHAACTPAGDLVPKNTKRHLKTQMKVFMGDFQKDFTNINDTYMKDFSGFNKYSKPAFDFVPKFQKPQKKSKVLLRNLHQDLQKYVVALHYLSTVRLSSDLELWRKVEPKRKTILHNISQHTKRLLCEVETAVNNSCQAVPERIPATFALEQGLSLQLKSFSELCLQDLGILNRFYDFMRVTNRKLLRNLPSKESLENVTWCSCE